MIHTCSLEVSRKIKEAEIKIKTFWFWWVDCKKQTKLEDHYPCEYTKKNFGMKCVPAPTLGELIRELPREIEDYPLVLSKYNKGWLVEYLQANPEGGHYWHKGWMAEIDSDTPEDCCAEMLIRLRKEKVNCNRGASRGIPL